jgi:hypothetical protein
MEKITYNSEYEKSIEERREKPLIFVEETETGLIVDIGGVKIESMAQTKEELEKIIGEIYLIPEAFEILQSMAIAYSQDRGLIVEGATSLGKTFLMNKFTALVFGEQARPVDFYCNGQTDVSELMGKWVPETDDPADSEKWEMEMCTPEGKSKLEEIWQAVKDGKIKGEEGIIKAMIGLCYKLTGKKPKSWKFEYGALPKAMIALKDPSKPESEDNPPVGLFLHVQEVGLAETHVIDALLALGGEKGKLAKEIQLHQDSGRTIKSEPKFWVYYSTNPPEDYPNRQAIDQALARRNTFVRAPELSPQSELLLVKLSSGMTISEIEKKAQDDLEQGNEELHLALEYVKQRNSELFFPQKEGGGSVELWKDVDIKHAITDVVFDFHQTLKKNLKAGGGAIEEEIRKQKFALTMDELHMTWDALLRFNTADILATLDRAIELHYINRFSETGREKVRIMWRISRDNTKLQERIEKVLLNRKKTNSFESGISDAEIILFQTEIEEFCSEVDETIKKVKVVQKNKSIKK